MRLTVRPRAERDLEEAFVWYDTRSPGLGAVFLDSVEACLQAIRERPELYAVADGRVRRGRLRRFPYCVYYVIRDDRVDVLAVYHSRRRPRSFES